jgi:hypothetical protein
VDKKDEDQTSTYKLEVKEKENTKLTDNERKEREMANDVHIKKMIA